MSVLQSLYANLQQAGIEAVLNTEKPSILARMNPFGGMTGQKMGELALKNRPVDRIVLYAHWEKRSGASFGSTIARDRLEAVDIAYVLDAGVKGNRNDLGAVLDVQRTGLVNKKVVDMKWKGAKLADRLNEDKGINELLWQSLGQLSARDIRIKFGEKEGNVEIYVRDDRQVFSGKLPPVELYEKIATHILMLAGQDVPVKGIATAPEKTLTNAPHPAPDEGSIRTVVTESAVKESDTVTTAHPQNVKYCFKCGTQMPQDASYCPRCGVKQDY